MSGRESMVAAAHTVGIALLLASLGACVTTSGVRVATEVAGGSGVPAPLDASMDLVRDQAIVTLLRDVSPARMRETDSILVSFGTRHTMSDTLSRTRGIGAARRFLFARLGEYSAACSGCLDVTYDAAMAEVTRHPEKPRVNVVNVLARLRGRDTSRVIVVMGHYDSCICSTDPFDFTSDAPGANDDGSGTSAVVELARVFSQRFPAGLAATVIFALVAGEEQGLLGSTQLALRLSEAGLTVTAAMTNDIIGNVSGDDARVDSTSVRIFGADPDDGPSRELLRYAQAAGLVYMPQFAVYPVFRLDRLGRGGDHRPFVVRGSPAIRFTERIENYKRQHLPGDVLDGVSFGYAANVARLNAAVIGSLASAPPPPDSVSARRELSSGGQKWMLRWKPVSAAASYELLLRRTTSPTHETIIRVNDATSHLLGAQLDDLWAGVRAVGPNGHRSLVRGISR